MTPTSFEFTVTMPVDARLVAAVRQLAVQAAGYAQLSADAGEGLAGHVEHAIEQAIALAPPNGRPLALRFAGAADAVNITISRDATGAEPAPQSAASDGLSVTWNIDGARHTCQIRQRIPA